MWIVDPDEKPTEKPSSSPLEIVAEAIGARKIFEDDTDIAKRVFADLYAAGYRIAVTRTQWR